MIKRFSLIVLASLLGLSSEAQPIDPNRPHLVVNIVISGMRSIDLGRYQSNLDGGGLRTIYEEGTLFTDCQYNYQQTTTPVSLATLSTGAQPSTHGVVGYSWYDYVINSKVDLIADSAAKNLEYSSVEEGYSSVNLVAPTVSDALLLDSPKSQAITVALDPASAIVLNGREGTPFWFDARTCNWASSTAYMSELPEWIAQYNDTEADINRTSEKWSLTLHPDLYVNSRYLEKPSGFTVGSSTRASRKESRAERFNRYHNIITHSPIGNDIVANFAKMAIANNRLGSDESVDLLNICFDASRYVTERFGPESMEAEDMFYKLDVTIADLMDFISDQLDGCKVVYVVTSDHGTSPSSDAESNSSTQFNARQFEVILNGFLSARYGSGNWVLSCVNRSVYLNHNTIYERDANLTDIQNETATFALQLSGVSQAMTATALRSSYFGTGYAHLIQNSFYPSRSGDVILNLMPHWIERDDHRRSQSGSMYNYDRHVPLLIYGDGVPARVESQYVDATSIASTITSIMGVEEPAASEGKPLEINVINN